MFPFLKGNHTMKNLKRYGYIRRMDDLGRIMLPKELRQFLALQECTALEISLMDNGIFIEKYQPLKTLESLCEQYLYAFAQSCNVVAAICCTDHVVASRGICLSKDIILSKELQNIINGFLNYQYSRNMTISLFDNGKYPIDTVYPIGTKENPLGAIVLLHYRNTTAEEKACAKLIATILTELITNQ